MPPSASTDGFETVADPNTVHQARAIGAAPREEKRDLGGMATVAWCELPAQTGVISGGRT